MPVQEEGRRTAKSPARNASIASSSLFTSIAPSTECASPFCSENLGSGNATVSALFRTAVCFLPIAGFFIPGVLVCLGNGASLGAMVVGNHANPESPDISDGEKSLLPSMSGGGWKAALKLACGTRVQCCSHRDKRPPWMYRLPWKREICARRPELRDVEIGKRSSFTTRYTRRRLFPRFPVVNATTMTPTFAAVSADDSSTPARSFWIGLAWCAHAARFVGWGIAGLISGFASCVFWIGALVFGLFGHLRLEAQWWPAALCLLLGYFCA